MSAARREHVAAMLASIRGKPVETAELGSCHGYYLLGNEEDGARDKGQAMQSD